MSDSQQYDKNKPPHKKTTTKGLRRIYNAFFYSLDGFKAAFCDEAAFRQICALCVICIPLAVIITHSWIEMIILLFPCFLALIVELFNSAIENTIDYISKDIHPLAKKAKDMGSATQFCVLAFWAIVWGSYGIYNL